MSDLAGSVHAVPPMFCATAYVAPLAGAVRARVAVPVMVAGRINQPQVAERILADGRGDWRGLAETRAREGRHVRLAANGVAAGAHLQVYARDRWVGVRPALGLDITAYARPFGVDGDSASVAPTASAAPLVFEGVGTVVLTLPPRPESTLARALDGFAGTVTAIGDCRAPRACEEAVLEGPKAGHEVSVRRTASQEARSCEA